jgi:16S rRNA (adenine1518-N6/adenine1519-N6)-dimethyltransferase
VENLPLFFRIVKAGFSQKRKMLRNTLSAGMRLKIPDCEMILKNADIDPARRAQTLEPVEWVNLTDEFIRQNSKKDA